VGDVGKEVGGGVDVEVRRERGRRIAGGHNCEVGLKDKVE
jgi:hypothetical protein